MVFFKHWEGGRRVYNLNCFPKKTILHSTEESISTCLITINKLFFFFIIIRQGIIDKYNNNNEIFIFLLSTRSGKWSLWKCFFSFLSTSIYYFENISFWVYMNCLKIGKTEKFSCIDWHQLLAELM